MKGYVYQNSKKNRKVAKKVAIIKKEDSSLESLFFLEM